MSNNKQRISLAGAQITVIISVTLVLALCGMVAMLGIVADAMGKGIKGNVGFVVEMADSVPQGEAEALVAKIQKSPFTSSSQYSSPDDILAEEQQVMGTEIIDLLDENPYHGEIDVKVCEPWSSPDSVKAIAERLAKDPSVQAVRMHTGAIATAHSSLHRVAIVTGAIALLLLIIALVLINNTVSISVYSRRFVIHTMRLVGAKGAFICRPFVARGALNGAIAGVLAAGILLGMRAWATTVEASMSSWLSTCVMLWICLSTFAAGILLCSTASWLATLRYLRLNHDDLYRR